MDCWSTQRELTHAFGRGSPRAAQYDVIETSNASHHDAWKSAWSRHPGLLVPTESAAGADR